MTVPDAVLCGRMLIGGTLRYAEAGIADGRICELGGHVGGGERIELGTSMTVLPGFVDPHVHLRDPGMKWKEDFSTGTTAAVCGGVTAVLDMPNTSPPVTGIGPLRDKKRAVAGRAYCDYGLFAALFPGCPVSLLAPYVCGFKLFMGSTTGNILLDDDAEIAQLMSEVSAVGRPVSVHAEDDSRIAHGVEEACCQDHLRNRPAEAELSALRRLSRFKDANRINICHCTTAEQIAAAKGLGFSTEVALHHVLFDAQRYTSALYKVNPPIRDPASRNALRAAFLAGEADMVGTDHAPHTLEEKSGEFDAAPAGIPGVETTVPILMDWAASGEVPLAQVSRMASLRPAEYFGLNKGAIEVGRDADFAIFDMRKSVLIDQSRLHSKAGYSPYGGMRAVFPDTVIIRGAVQVREGEPCGDPVGKDQFARLRGRLLRGCRAEGGMPKRVRHVLPVPA